MVAALLPFLFIAGMSCAHKSPNVTLSLRQLCPHWRVLDGSAPDTVNFPGATWFACNNPALNAQIQTDGAEIALTNTPGTTNGTLLKWVFAVRAAGGSTSISSVPISARYPAAISGWRWASPRMRNNEQLFATYKCGSGWNCSCAEMAPGFQRGER